MSHNKHMPLQEALTLLRVCGIPLFYYLSSVTHSSTLLPAATEFDGNGCCTFKVSSSNHFFRSGTGLYELYLEIKIGGSRICNPQSSANINGTNYCSYSHTDNVKRLCPS